MLRNAQRIRRKRAAKKWKEPESAPSSFSSDLFVEMFAVAHRRAPAALGADVAMEVVAVALLGGPGGLLTPFYSTWVFQSCHILTRVIISGISA